MARDAEFFVKVSSPRIFLFRMLVFLVLVGLIAVLLHRQIWSAFLANPSLNGIILGALLVGIVMSIRQVMRLFPEVRWVNSFRLADPGLSVSRPPVLLAPMATLLGERAGRMTITQTTMRGILDSIGTRLDESREIARYLTGLLVFLGLLGTFWGLLETIGSIGRVIQSLEVGADTSRIFEDLKAGLAAPLGGMGIAFSSSLFGLAGSLILGFLDLQAGQAQTRFYTDLEDWLSTTVRDLGVSDGAGTAARSGDYLPGALVEEFASAIDRFEQNLKTRGFGGGGGVDATSMAGLTAVVHRLEQAIKPMSRMPEFPVDKITTAIEKLERVVEDSGGQRSTTAMVKLAESLQSLVQHMRTEQQMLRDWVESQAEQQNDIRELLKRLARTQAGAERA
jgi:hypothetical protein